MLTRPLTKAALPILLTLCATTPTAAEEDPSAPVELEVLKASVGVWDAEGQVWMQGLDQPPITFKGVETNRAYGEHWIASDFDSEFTGQVVRVHSIVGYDLDQKKLVGTVVDHGPYAATMTGEYDAQTKTLHWTTNAKYPNGQVIVQKSAVTHEEAGVRVLVLSMPDPEGAFKKFMQIKYVKRP